MDYWELREKLARVLPRMSKIWKEKKKTDHVQEKGRKSNYYEFVLSDKKWGKRERLLNEDEISSFLEISTRAQACPLPLNVDVWDGLVCPFDCKYCYANSFRHSLYSSFFDNSKSVGLRHCNPDIFKKELDKLFEGKGNASLNKALKLKIPVRFGIRFEDFLYIDRKKSVSLDLLNYFADNAYPVMINTKSALVGEEKYVEALARNKGKTAVHITLISGNKELCKKLEPGAPSYDKRIQAMKNLSEAGVRVVARIEPFLIFASDSKEDFKRYVKDLKEAGVKNITFDTYSYTGKSPGIRAAFMNEGYDWDRMFLLGADSQPFGSYILGKYMEEYRKRGFSCSTFDMGNVPDNDKNVCCEVSDWFEGGYNYGCSVIAARFISKRKNKISTWRDFENFVNKKGGFLSETLYRQVKECWNYDGTLMAYSHAWARGIKCIGEDENGKVWIFEDTDYREELVENIIKEL